MDFLKVKNRLLEHKKEVENNNSVIYIALQGSQNYGLDTENSDIDTKTFAVPSLYDIILNKKPVSYTHIMENEEHCDVKDIRLMFDCFRKQNINFLEILFTDYYFISKDYKDEINRLRELREEIAHYNNYAAINCMTGMAMEKFKALEHPYPTIKWKIDKWGYDGKQLHHILRMENFMDAFINGAPFKVCLTSFHIYDKETLIAAKKNLFELSDARKMAEESFKKINKRKEEYMSSKALYINDKVKKEMDDILYCIIKKSMKKELFEDENKK